VRHCTIWKISLAQMVRFLGVKLAHQGSNLKFDICIVFTTNYLFNGRRRSVDSETLFVTDFVDLKILLTYSFRGAHKGRVYVRILSARTCISICICVS
jgi:hypothetical protein